MPVDALRECPIVSLDNNGLSHNDRVRLPVSLAEFRDMCALLPPKVASLLAVGLVADEATARGPRACVGDLEAHRIDLCPDGNATRPRRAPPCSFSSSLRRAAAALQASQATSPARP